MNRLSPALNERALFSTAPHHHDALPRDSLALTRRVYRCRIRRFTSSLSLSLSRISACLCVVRRGRRRRLSHALGSKELSDETHEVGGEVVLEEEKYLAVDHRLLGGRQVFHEGRLKDKKKRGTQRGGGKR